jgi:hypothetical protein
MHIARTTLTAALLSTSLAAQTPPTTTDWLVLDPTTQVLGLTEGEEVLLESALLDFDDDGRLDLALLGTEGELGLVRDFAGHPRTIPLQAKYLGLRDVAACERDGRDALLTAGTQGLHLVSWDPQTGQAESQLLLTGSFSRILYARGTGIEGSLAWVVRADGRALQALLLDSATANVLLTGPVLPLPSDVGAAELVDYTGDDHAELAVTWAGGLYVMDPFANPIAIFERRFEDSTLAGDALVRLVDDNGNESISWIERNGEEMVITTASNDSIHFLAGAQDEHFVGHAALDVDGNGLADLVLGREDANGVRVLLARPTGQRFAKGSPYVATTALPQETLVDWNAPVHLSAGDVDRDGDADIVRVTGSYIDVMRSSHIDEDLLAPQLVSGSVEWDIDSTGVKAPNVAFALDGPYASVPYSKLVVELHAGHSPNTNLHSGQAAVQTIVVNDPVWPLEFDFTLPPVNATRKVWYVEARVVGGATGDFEYPSLVVALTSNADTHLINQVGVNGSLWHLHFTTSEYTIKGQGTAGSNGEVRIPRLPPPPAPPPTPITPVTTPTPGTGGGG